MLVGSESGGCSMTGGKAVCLPHRERLARRVPLDEVGFLLGPWVKVLLPFADHEHGREQQGLPGPGEQGVFEALCERQPRHYEPSLVAAASGPHCCCCFCHGYRVCHFVDLAEGFVKL